MSRGALTGTRNSSMGPPHEGSIRRLIAPWANALTTELHLAPCLVTIRTTHHSLLCYTLDPCKVLIFTENFLNHVFGNVVPRHLDPPTYNSNPWTLQVPSFHELFGPFHLPFIPLCSYVHLKGLFRQTSWGCNREVVPARITTWYRIPY